LQPRDDRGGREQLQTRRRLHGDRAVLLDGADRLRQAERRLFRVFQIDDRGEGRLHGHGERREGGLRGCPRQAERGGAGGGGVGGGGWWVRPRTGSGSGKLRRSLNEQPSGSLTTRRSMSAQRGVTTMVLCTCQCGPSAPSVARLTTCADRVRIWPRTLSAS